jgi:hypothetical protein
MAYEISFKEEVIRRVFYRNNDETLRRISQETGVTQRTISRWMKSFEKMTGAKRHLQVDSKITAFLDTLNIDFESKSKYCRTQGLYIEELNTWELEMKKILQEGVVSELEYNKLKTEKHQLAKKLHLKTKELEMKDKALAEAAALLLLQKKAQDLFLAGEQNSPQT